MDLTQVCEAHDRVILSFRQQVQGLARPTCHRGIEGKHWAQCARVRRCKEEHTLTERQCWGPSNNTGLRMVNWESQSKTPQSLGDGRIYSSEVKIAFIITHKEII